MKKFLLVAISLAIFFTNAQDINSGVKTDWTGNIDSAWEQSGNWVGGSVPDSTSDVTIDADLANYPIVSSDVSVNSVSVATGASLTISSDGSLTTTGDFTNTGTVTMNSDSQEFSSLIVGGTSTGDINYNRFVNEYSEPGDDNIQWDLIGSPVDGLEISTFTNDNPSLATSGDYYAVGTYDNSSQLWTNYTSATSNGVNFDMGLGYQMATSVVSSTVASSSSFNAGSNTNWPYNVVGSLASDGNNGEAQTFEINVRGLPVGGANYRVYKTTSNGIDFFENGQPLSLGVNTITVTAVSFARTVKLQVSSGDIAFNSLIVNSQTLYGNTFSGSTLLFEGSVATVPQTQTITDNTTSGGDFWNLVSNPYPSYLNLNYKSNAINNFVSVNGVSVYGWKSGSNGAYTVYNQISPTPSTAQYIAPGQGFFVSAESASSVSFTNAMQTTSGSDDFVSGRMDGSYTYFYLNLNEGDDLIANSMFYFGDGMSYGFDAGYDAEAFRQSTKIMSRMLEGNVGLGMQVNAMPKEALDDSTVIPLEINQTAGTAFSIGLADVFNLAEDVEVYLEDTQLQTFTDLKAGDYTINPENDLSGIGRFYLVFVNNSLGGNTMHESNIRIYNPLDEDYISIEGLLNVQNTKVNLYNIFGQQVLNTALNKNQSAHRISTAELAAGVYVIKLKADNAVISKKLIIR